MSKRSLINLHRQSPLDLPREPVKGSWKMLKSFQAYESTSLQNRHFAAAHQISSCVSNSQSFVFTHIPKTACFTCFDWSINLNRTNFKLIFIFLFVVTAAGVVPCGSPKKARTPSIVQFIFYFWSFEISRNILRIQNIFYV